MRMNRPRFDEIARLSRNVWAHPHLRKTTEVLAELVGEHEQLLADVEERDELVCELQSGLGEIEAELEALEALLGRVREERDILRAVLDSKGLTVEVLP